MIASVLIFLRIKRKITVGEKYCLCILFIWMAQGGTSIKTDTKKKFT